MCLRHDRAQSRHDQAHHDAARSRSGNAGAIVCRPETGVLFGPERTGLFNDDLALADTSLTVPLNPSFSSLNLAQAVLLIGYEWYQTGDVTPGRYLHTGATRAARKEELVNFFDHLEQELTSSGFFSSPEKKPSMIRSIRNCFQRMDMTEQEVRTFHGIVSAFDWPKNYRRKNR